MKKFNSIYDPSAYKRAKIYFRILTNDRIFEDYIGSSFWPLFTEVVDLLAQCKPICNIPNIIFHKMADASILNMIFGIRMNAVLTIRSLSNWIEFLYQNKEFFEHEFYIFISNDQQLVLKTELTGNRFVGRKSDQIEYVDLYSGIKIDLIVRLQDLNINQKPEIYAKYNPFYDKSDFLNKRYQQECIYPNTDKDSAYFITLINSMMINTAICYLRGDSYGLQRCFKRRS